MRKILVLALAVGIPLVVYAQQPTQYVAETDHYRVISETSQSQAEELSRQMEAALTLYNSIFHFDLALLPAKLNVKIFKDLDSFNSYVSSVISQTRTDFVFIAWSDPARSELLCFPKERKAFTTSLLHQGAIQFLKGFVDNSPLWLREGVATYLDASQYDPDTSTFVFHPNLLWLDGLKAGVSGESPQKLIPFTDLLNFTRDMAQANQVVFMEESWGLVHFLLNSGQDGYARIMWDAISSLDPRASLEANSAKVRKRAFSWISDQKLRQDFDAFVLSLKTGNDLVHEGIDQYTKGDLASAEQTLTRAITLQPDASAGWYYLGLIAYSHKNYPKADDLYMKAFQLGANAATINYALGVNAFAAGRNPDAVKYLRFAKTADPATYGDKVDALLKRIPPAQ
ncbi:MAG TPA: tetratricopeptide repeat protein [Spirochaetia bacterium]|nr:tetratricopeptide repeat protein [Spirochaetia bacterium]